MQKEFRFTYELQEDIAALEGPDRQLMEMAREHTQNAYAPYSSFRVAAVGLLDNGAIVKSTNQENASYPVGICAERVLLSTIASVHPGVALKKVAISYHNQQGNSDHPIAPCGMCRQALLEQETRFSRPIEILLSGMEGPVILIHDALELLPFNFSAMDMLTNKDKDIQRGK